jgi:hypothetical protein
MGLSRNDFSEVYLFFDYDAHQTNVGNADAENVLHQMLENFDNETENGKLYISYPMVEALRDFEPGICGKPNNCFVAIKDMGEYKNVSSTRSFNPHFRDYDFEDWKEIVDVFALRISCLLGQEEVVSYEQYLETASPYDIYICEENENMKHRVFILSAFPEFLVDYFGIKLWKACVKHTKNQLENQCCK